MPSPDSQTIDSEGRRRLLDLARTSIAHGLIHGRAPTVDPEAYPPELREPRAAFVTLTEGGALRGCIGHLEAVQPLVTDVAENAYAAAFQDPRFPALRESELPRLAIEISVLTPAQPLHFDSEADLLRQIEPGRDGLILHAGSTRGTFLPSVWESLPDPENFLQHLKMKAGLRSDFWSDDLQIFRYRTESFTE